MVICVADLQGGATGGREKHLVSVVVHIVIDLSVFVTATVTFKCYNIVISQIGKLHCNPRLSLSQTTNVSMKLIWLANNMTMLLTVSKTPRLPNDTVLAETFVHLLGASLQMFSNLLVVLQTVFLLLHKSKRKKGSRLKGELAEID